MRKSFFASLIAIGATLFLLASSADRSGASAQVSEGASAPGEGVLCSWAILSALTAIAKKCHAGEDPELQAELDNSIARFDAYVLANGVPLWTRADIEAFKRQQGKADEPVTAFCAHKDVDYLYQASRKAGATEIRKTTDELLSRPGNPQWGSCL